MVGTYLVQRRMALLGDGIGHMALTGVAMGWLAGAATGAGPNDLLAVPGAVVASLIVAAPAVPLLRPAGRPRRRRSPWAPHRRKSRCDANPSTTDLCPTARLLVRVGGRS